MSTGCDKDEAHNNLKVSFFPTFFVLRFFLPLFHLPACHLHASADHVPLTGVNLYQLYGPSGQYTHEFDGDEQFYVDLGKKGDCLAIASNLQVLTRRALTNIAVAKHNLDILIKRSNSTAATNEVPEVTVFSKLLSLNTLICLVDNIFPLSWLNITWLSNGHSVTEGVSETSFLSKKPDIPAPMSELTETVVCALGLSVGLAGSLWWALSSSSEVCVQLVLPDAKDPCESHPARE
ncbi:LOW QUALITY PROTEIN: HLA class II histocompatibility antigen, DQ alpha 1 chain, partial [Plecturocebus cupreus]